MKKKPNVFIIILLVLICVGLCYFAGYEVGKYLNNKEDNQSSSDTKQEEEKENNITDKESNPVIISRDQFIITYTNKKFTIQGNNINCSSNYDKLFTETSSIENEEISSAKILFGFSSDASLSGIIITKSGKVYSVNFDCNGKLHIVNEEIFKNYKIKDVLKIDTPGCNGSSTCEQTAEVILQDGSTKIIKRAMNS